MRCCASPTTSTAADAGAPETIGTDAARSARDVAAALLFREILKPLAQGLGPLADVALGTVVDALATRRPR